MLSKYQIKVIRTRLAAQQGWRCYWCGLPMVTSLENEWTVTLDHIIPKHAGGEDRHDNFCASHFKCNSERHPEINRRPAALPLLAATTGETVSDSPFAILKGLIK